MKTPSFISTSFLLSFSFSSAATLATYAFGSGPNTLPSTSGVTATAITYGSGLGTPQTSAATFAPSGPSALGLVTATATPTTISAAITANSFFIFTLTPSAGSAIELTEFTFWANYSGDTTAANQLALQINTGSGYQTIGTTVFDVTGAASPGKFFAIPITGLGQVTGATDFRVVMYDSAGVNWTSFTRMDDLTINGNVVPEPSELFLLGIGGLLPLRRKRAR